MKELLSELVAYLKTKDSLSYFLTRLDNAILDLSMTDLTHLDLYFTQKEISMLMSKVQSVNDLRELREQLSRVEVFTVKLAFKPTAFFENQVNEFVIKAVRELCVTQIVFDRSIIGGAVVDFKGRYRDYSLKTAVDEWRRRRA